MFFVISAILFVLLICLTNGSFLFTYFRCLGYSVNKSLGLSRYAMSGNKAAVCRYIFGFTGIFLLSLLTVCTLFVVYTIPLMIFAYFIYAEKITENIDFDYER